MHWYYSELRFDAAFTDSKSGASSWANVNIGEASAERIIVVATSDTAGTHISAVTVGGIAATRRANGSYAQIWTASVPTGTTATISVTSSSGTLNGIGVYAIYGLNSAVPFDTGTGTTSAPVDVQAGGFVIACFSGTPVQGAWVNVTQDYSASVSGDHYSSASDLFETAQTVNVTRTATGNMWAVASASFGPT